MLRVKALARRSGERSQSGGQTVCTLRHTRVCRV